MEFLHIHVALTGARGLTESLLDVLHRVSDVGDDPVGGVVVLVEEQNLGCREEGGMDVGLSVARYAGYGPRTYLGQSYVRDLLW